MPTLSLSKSERLKSKKLIDSLFTDGKSCFIHPFKIQYRLIPKSENPLQFTCTVPKRNFKKAVDRNLIKRRTKEAYRIQKTFLREQLTTSNYSLICMFVYIDRQILTYSSIEKSMKNALLKLGEKIS